MLKAFEINDIKLLLVRVNFCNYALQFIQSHVLLLSMFFRQCIKGDRRGACYLNSAKVAVILVAPYPQYVARAEMGFAFIANGDGFTSRQNVILKTLKKSNVVWLHGIIPCR